jgi:hypothetical protein
MSKLEDVITKSKLSDAFRMALERSGRKVVRTQGSVFPPVTPYVSPVT